MYITKKVWLILRHLICGAGKLVYIYKKGTTNKNNRLRISEKSDKENHRLGAWCFLLHLIGHSCCGSVCVCFSSSFFLLLLLQLCWHRMNDGSNSFCTTATILSFQRTLHFSNWKSHDCSLQWKSLLWKSHGWIIFFSFSTWRQQCPWNFMNHLQKNLPSIRVQKKRNTWSTTSVKTLVKHMERPTSLPKSTCWRMEFTSMLYSSLSYYMLTDINRSSLISVVCFSHSCFSHSADITSHGLIVRWVHLHSWTKSLMPIRWKKKTCRELWFSH